MPKRGVFSPRDRPVRRLSAERYHNLARSSSRTDATCSRASVKSASKHLAWYAAPHAAGGPSWNIPGCQVRGPCRGRGRARPGRSPLRARTERGATSRIACVLPVGRLDGDAAIERPAGEGPGRARRCGGRGDHRSRSSTSRTRPSREDLVQGSAHARVTAAEAGRTGVRDRPIARATSMNTMRRGGRCLTLKRSRTRAAPMPTDRLRRDETRTQQREETAPGFAGDARAKQVFPSREVRSGTPWGIRPPRRRVLLGTAKEVET